MNAIIVPAIKQLPKISPSELTELKKWMKYVEPFMIKSVSSYAQGRRELHLRHYVKLANKDSRKLDDEVVKIPDSVAKKYKSELIESIGERVLPGFHEGLVLHYPKGTLIKPHRDSRAYEKGAASINIIGDAIFFISHDQDAANMQSYQLGEGDCIQFDNKQPHAIAKVEQDRWCCCFFYLKEEFLPKPSEQLALFPSVQMRNQKDSHPEEVQTIQGSKKIYTSYYQGMQIGRSISISLYKPKPGKKGNDFDHEILFAPSPELLRAWKDSTQGEAAIAEYTKQFLADMAVKDKEVDSWLEKIESEGTPVTLNCYEEDSPDRIDNPFCHRHLVGQIFKRKKPHLWGGEVSYAILKNLDPEPIDIGFKEGDPIKYFYPKENLWLDATFKQVHTTNFNKPGQFSFIEVIVGRYTLKAFSLSQIKSA